MAANNNTDYAGASRKGFDSLCPSNFKQQHKITKSMEKSESIRELASALSKFQAQVPKIDLDREVEVSTKSGWNYKFKYATFANILEKIRIPLSESGLSFTQLVNEDGSVTTILMHTSGEWISSKLLITGEKTPQGIGSAITYMKRYSLSSILGICADDDDDANAAQGNQINECESNKPKTTTVNRKVVPIEKMLEDDFLKALHDLDKKNRAAGKREPLHSILEKRYVMTVDDIKKVCLAVGEYEKKINDVLT